MGWGKDIVGVEAVKKGTFRSLNGAADENIFIGRASKAGFFCFFKVWRDMPYDAVLDYENVLFRVEVKGSSNGKFNVTRGTRSGRQIVRGTSRTRILDRDDCDFVVGVDSTTGDCYIIPEDIVSVIDRLNLSYKTLANYKEKWELFIWHKTGLSKEQTRDGLCNMTQDQLDSLAATLAVDIPANDLAVPGTTVTISDAKDKTVYCIWNELAKRT